jgi:hypothetical protein
VHRGVEADNYDNDICIPILNTVKLQLESLHMHMNNNGAQLQQSEIAFRCLRQISAQQSQNQKLKELCVTVTQQNLNSLLSILSDWNIDNASAYSGLQRICLTFEDLSTADSMFETKLFEALNHHQLNVLQIVVIESEVTTETMKDFFETLQQSFQQMNYANDSTSQNQKSLVFKLCLEEEGALHLSANFNEMLFAYFTLFPNGSFRVQAPKLEIREAQSAVVKGLKLMFDVQTGTSIKGNANAIYVRQNGNREIDYDLDWICECPLCNANQAWI